MKSISRTALVPYQAEQMFALVDDIAAYPEFLPWCSAARVLAQQEDYIDAEVEIAKAGVRKTFVTRNRRQSGKVIEMRLVRGPFHHLQGLWQFAALGDQGCKISLDLQFEFSNMILSATVGPVFQQIGNSLVDAFCRRAEEVYGKHE